jgi:MoaA/NifB/PqqE/SkfB family radical SAM enzyme
MDGIGRTYEILRGKSFQVFVRQLRYVREIAPFGINFVVNTKTIHDLEDAVAIAHNEGAAEFLLLPEQPVLGEGGINTKTLHTLRAWVESYRGSLRISISEAHAEGFPICDPFSVETGLFAYAHIDAAGVLKRSSYDLNGIPIGHGGVIEALQHLREQTGGQL